MHSFMGGAGDFLRVEMRSTQQVASIDSLSFFSFFFKASFSESSPLFFSLLAPLFFIFSKIKFNLMYDTLFI